MKFIVLALVALSIQTAHATTAPSDLSWFGDIQPPSQVTPLIWRSGRPTEDALQALWAHGVRTIIDLEDNAEATAREASDAKQMGFEFHSYPTDSFWAPDDAKIDEILGLLRDSKTPVLVHCYHGEDRTGLVIGLERVYFEKWPAQKAYDEMLKIGFHQILVGLDQYFWSKAAAVH